MTELPVPHDPLPLDPRHEHVIDGAHLALRWEAIPEADRYRVQIALDPDFYETVFEKELPGGVSTLAVRRHFPEDDRTFYWRVLAGGPGGWSAGGRIESFISGRADQVGRYADPDEAEPFGPLAALFTTATLEAVAEALPGDQPSIDRALHDDHPEGVEGAELLTLEMGLLVVGAIVIAVVLVFLVYAC